MLNLREKLIDILTQIKKIPNEELQRLIQLQKEKQIPLRRLLIEEKVIAEEELLSVLSEHLRLPTLNLAKYKFDPKVIDLVPEQLCCRYGIIPLSRIGNTLTVAMCDPLNIFALDDLKATTGCEVDIVLSRQEEINAAINSQYRSQAASLEQFIEDLSAAPSGDKAKGELFFVQEQELELSQAVKESSAPPIVKLVDLMLIQALKRRASDIHIEPEEDCLRIRYRIDGNLHDVLRLPKKNQNAVLARLKIISTMNITESRLPQDGRFKARLQEQEVDFRVSALPTVFGQKFVLRILDKSNLSIGLDKLGFSEQPLRLFREAIKRPFGMILVTGPTGSGKSTTLYSIINQLNSIERHIVTIEDPVEYELEGITQVQARHEIGLNFASGLRSVLRQSPDIIMVGEIRDSETADIAIKSALTGQLILSTLHTNDAVSSVTRLIDMGTEPFLVASSLIMAAAQRLCRRLCLKCRQIYEVPKEVLKELGIEERLNFYRIKGCGFCQQTGFYGRIAMLEVLMIDDEIRQMIIKRESLDKIKEYAIKKQGMKTLRDDALLKVKEGLTTLEEALRITTEE